MDRNARSRRQQQARRIERRTGSVQAMEFFNVLTSPELIETTEALMPAHRERLYPPTVTLSMFMSRRYMPTDRARTWSTAGRRSGWPLGWGR